MSIARTRHAYAAMLSRQGRHRESIEMYQSVLKSLRALEGEQTINYVECRDDFGAALLRAGRAEEAHGIFEQVIRQSSQLLGTDWVIGPLLRLAEAKLALSDVPGAELTLRDALLRYAHHVFARSSTIHQEEDWRRRGRTALNDREVEDMTLSFLIDIISDVPLESHFDPGLYVEILKGIASLNRQQMKPEAAARFRQLARSMRESRNNNVRLEALQHWD